MQTAIKRIAINFGGGYVPGLNAVISGAVLAANKLGWETVGIRDGYDGLLFRDRYVDGGLVKLTPQIAEDIAADTGCILGTAVHSDPFHVRTVNADNLIEEVDRSDELLQTIQKENIDAVISVVGSRALSILWKLSRKGLKTVCVPKSVENDVAASMLSFGFNTTLSFVAEMLERAKQAARSARRIAVVEVLGAHTGWLSLQAGMAVHADAVLIPEIRYDLKKVAAKLREKARTSGLVVVAEGARPIPNGNGAKNRAENFKDALSPNATGSQSSYVIDQSGKISEDVAHEIQRLTDHETSPLVLGELAKGGTPTVIDRQLGMGYGAGAVRALNNNQTGVMVVFQPPDLKFVPISEALNKVRTVPANSEFVQIARALDISLGD